MLDVLGVIIAWIAIRVFLNGCQAFSHVGDVLLTCFALQVVGETLIEVLAFVLFVLANCGVIIQVAVITASPQETLAAIVEVALFLTIARAVRQRK